MNEFKVLIGCETSGTVRDAFARLGFDAWSCDILPSDQPSNRHIQDDIRNVLEMDDWDLCMVAHPPCTRLCNSGVRWLSKPPQGKTVQDNIYSSFTFGKEEFLEYRRNVRKGTGKWKGEYGNMEALPIEERWSARFFEPKDVFQNLDLDSAVLLKTESFHNITTWDEYLAYMKSDYALEIVKPPSDMFSYKEFNPVAVDN